MTKRPLLLLAITTAVVIGAAWVSTQQRMPQTELRKRPLYPGLLERVNEVGKIEVKSKDHTVVIAKQGNDWGVENRGNFPAQFEKVKGAVVALAEARILETKTKNKELYPRLGVEEVDTEGASSRLVSLMDQGGQRLASLILGKERTAAAGAGAQYVRKAGDAQALLVEGHFDISANPPDWLHTELFNISADRIRDISIQHKGQNPIRIHRKDAKSSDYTLENIPSRSKLKSQVTLNGLATALEGLRLDDVVPRASFTLPAQYTVTRLSAFDGLIATVTSARLDDRVHASFEFSYDAEAAKAHESEKNPEQPAKPPAPTESAAPGPTGDKPKESKPKQTVAEEVAALNTQVRDWVYLIPDYKAAMLTKKLDELIASTQDEKPGSAPGGHAKGAKGARLGYFKAR